MSSTPASPIAAAPRVPLIIDTVIKVSVDATRPLPMACALYAVEIPRAFGCARITEPTGACSTIFLRRTRKSTKPNWASPFSTRNSSPKTIACPVGTLQERAIHGVRRTWRMRSPKPTASSCAPLLCDRLRCCALIAEGNSELLRDASLLQNSVGGMAG